MKCPFLREAKVKSCEASPYRKKIPQAATAERERCSSPSWRECPAARDAVACPTPRCPFLREEHAEFCAAAPVPKYVPATSALSSRCNSDAHAYCSIFLALADPAGERLPHGRRETLADEGPWIDALPVPEHLVYAPNHLWLRLAPDGQCHAGIDAFLAWVIGRADAVRFLPSRPDGGARAVITAGGFELPVELPSRVPARTPNAYLRTRPERLTEDPYGAGWLFEGFAPEADREAIRTGFVEGKHARLWMRAEVARAAEFVHEQLVRTDPAGIAYVADGGTPAEGFARHLDRDTRDLLFDEFFSSRRIA